MTKREDLTPFGQCVADTKFEGMKKNFEKMGIKFDDSLAETTRKMTLNQVEPAVFGHSGATVTRTVESKIEGPFISGTYKETTTTTGVTKDADVEACRLAHVPKVPLKDISREVLKKDSKGR